MKKLLITLALVLAMVIPAMAQDADLLFSWNDDNVKTQGYSWRLYQRIGDAGYNYDEPIAVIAWSEGQTDFTTNKVVQVDGTPGEKVMLHFVMRAVDADGYIADDSNEASQEIKMLKAVYSLTIKLNVN